MPRQVSIDGRTLTESDLDCPDCGSMLILASFQGKPLYRCARHKTTGCRGCHGAHPDGSPMGTPAHWTVREVRKKAHGVFDLLWRGERSRMTRGAAYRWLQGAMKMSEHDAHISRFDAAQCEMVLTMVRADFGLEPERDPGEGNVGFYELRF